MSNLSEEEKQAIEYLKTRLYENEGCELINNTLLNLIEKQQKEIEELEDITRVYDSMQGIMPERNPIIIADKKYFDSGRFIENYISKDKIRNLKIKYENKCHVVDPNKISDVYQTGKYFGKAELCKELLEGK